MGEGDGIEQASWRDCATFPWKERCSLHGEEGRQGRRERIEEEKRHKRFVAHVTSRLRRLTRQRFRTQSTILRRLPGTEAK